MNNKINDFDYKRLKTMTQAVGKLLTYEEFYEIEEIYIKVYQRIINQRQNITEGEE